MRTITVNPRGLRRGDVLIPTGQAVTKIEKYREGSRQIRYRVYYGRTSMSLAPNTSVMIHRYS